MGVCGWRMRLCWPGGGVVKQRGAEQKNFGNHWINWFSIPILYLLMCMVIVLAMRPSVLRHN